MTKNRKVLLISIAASIVLCLLIIKACSHLSEQIGQYAADGSSEQYLESNKKHIAFETTKCETINQWDTIKARLDTFLVLHPQYRVPDSLKASQITCTNCEIYERFIYFQEEPQEFYIVAFDKDGFSHIDWIYQYRNGKEFEIETNTLNDSEKERIKSRLKVSVLDSINWNIKNIY